MQSEAWQVFQLMHISIFASPKDIQNKDLGWLKLTFFLKSPWKHDFSYPNQLFNRLTLIKVHERIFEKKSILDFCITSLRRIINLLFEVTDVK